MPESEVQRSLGRIEGQLGELKDTIETHIDRLDSKFMAAEIREKLLEDRLRANEAKMHWWSGVSGVVGAGLGTFIATVIAYLGKHP